MADGLARRRLAGLVQVRYSGRAVWTLVDDLDAFYLERRRVAYALSLRRIAP